MFGESHYHLVHAQLYSTYCMHLPTISLPPCTILVTVAEACPIALPQTRIGSIGHTQYCSYLACLYNSKLCVCYHAYCHSMSVNFWLRAPELAVGLVCGASPQDEVCHHKRPAGITLGAFGGSIGSAMVPEDGDFILAEALQPKSFLARPAKELSTAKLHVDDFRVRALPRLNIVRREDLSKSPPSYSCISAQAVQS